jgi:diguanylate cyclase (GGDEF)-like protein
MVTQVGDAGSDADLRQELGRAIQARAGEVGEMVRASWEARAAPCGLPPEELSESIFVTTRMATDLIGRYVATGEAATDAESAFMATRSTVMVVRERMMTDLLKNYLCWRDGTLQILREEATRLGSPRPLVREVAAVVGFSTDVSLIRMVREFDKQRGELQLELDEERAKLEHLALHDPLTGLANRTLLLDRLTQAIAGTARRTEQVGVLFLDLDGFKGINDTLGHQVGDQLLVAVAGRLSRLVRPSDTVARLGGDEFVVVCGDLISGETSLQAVRQRIETELGAPFAELGGIVVGVSVGGAVAETGEASEHVLARADAGMYRVKEERRQTAPVTSP